MLHRARLSVGPPATSKFDKGKNWLFLTIDDLSDPNGPAFSAEAKSIVWVGRCLPTSGDVSIHTAVDDTGKERPLATVDDLQGHSFTDSSGGSVDYFRSYYDEHGDLQNDGGLADHWHIYAHGYHWVAVSMTYLGSGYGVLPIKFSIDEDGNFSEAWRSVVHSPTFSGTDCLHPTNDLCMVADADDSDFDAYQGVYVIVSNASADGSHEADGPNADQGTLWIGVNADGAISSTHVVNGTPGRFELGRRDLAHYAGASASAAGESLDRGHGALSYRVLAAR